MLFFSGVHVSEPLWALIDIYGLTRGVQLLGESLRETSFSTKWCLLDKDTGLFRHAGVIRKVCQALWSPWQLFVLNAKNASTLKYQPAPSVILLTLISFSHPPLRMGVLFYTAGNHSTSGAFPVQVVIKGTLQTASQLVSRLPNNSMEKDPGDFRACAIVSRRGCGFKL